MKFLEKLESNANYWFLVLISLFFFLLRFPSLFEPNWYGDEGIYQTLGIGMNAGRLLYKGIFDNKPPLLYLLYSFVSSDQFAIRLLSLIFGLAALVTFFFLAKKIIDNKKAVYIATSFFAILFGLPLIEGNIANAENFMLFPNILAGLLVLTSVEAKSQKTKYWLQFFAGVVVAISFLFKIVAVFDFAAFFAFLFFANYSKRLIDIFKKNNLIKEVKNLLFITAGFILPILIVFIYFFLNGAAGDILRATFFANIGYVGYGNKFIIPQGFLILKLIALALFSLYLFYKRERFGNYFIFTAIWLGFSLFDAFFSQRPYTHYMLVLLPPLCLMIGLFATNKIFSRTAGVLSILTAILVLLNFTFYVKTVFYYQNFLSFVIGQKSVYNYRKFFDSNTPRDYSIADYITDSSNSSDNIFIWGNNAQVYKLTNKLPPGKYTVAYHITNYKDGLSDTKKGLKTANPKFIIIMPNVSSYPFSLLKYSPKINLNGAQIYERLY